MIQLFQKGKLTFLILFILLIYSTGKLFGVSDSAMNYKIIILFLVLFLFFLYKTLKNRDIRFFTSSQNSKKMFFLFGFLFVFISFFRDGFLNTYIYTVLLTFIATLIYIQFLYRLPLEQALKLFLQALFILLIVNYYAHYIKTGSFVLSSVDRSIEKRFTGVLGGGLAGALSGLTAILPLIIYYLSKNRNNLFLILCVILSWYAMLLADNRTSIIATTLIYMLVFFFMSKKNAAFKLVFILIIFIVYLFFHFYFLNTVGGKSLGDDADTRFLIWSYGVKQISINPILGSGKENPFMNNLSTKNILGDSIADPHNSYLYFILKNGVIISFSFFFFIFSYFVYSYKRMKNSKYLILLTIPLYWVIISYSGGDYFNFNFNFSSVVFGISVFGFLNHPDIISKRKRKGITVKNFR